MKDLLAAFGLVVSVANFAYQPSFGTYRWVYHDFDQAMHVTQFPKSLAMTNHVVGIDGQKLYTFFKNMYETNNLSVAIPTNELKIPKIIHMVWLGSPVPDAFISYIYTWFAKHIERGWCVKLWTDEDLHNFTLINQRFYDATDNYGVKSDLFKWEVVYRFGGVYVDVDFECYQPLDILHYTHDFYTGIQPLDSQFLQLGAALFGARSGHPILKQCIESIKDDWGERGAPAKSGPIHFTKAFFVAADVDNNCDIAYPAYYFYPLGCRQHHIKKDAWIQNGVWGVHHWAKSWMPRQYRLKKFHELNNDHLVTNWKD